MASILTNVLRNQARAALVAPRVRVSPSTAAFFGLALRQSAVAPSYSRSLSISRVVRESYGYDGERSRPQAPPSSTIFVGNLPYSIEQGELTDLLSQFGEIKSVRQGLRPDGTSKGYAHVEYAELSSAIKAIEAHQVEPFFISGRNARLDYAPPPNRVVSEPYHKLYIFNFPRDEATLRLAFKDFDEQVLSVRLLKDRDGNNLNAGFIEFGSVAEATEALTALNNSEFEYGMKLNLSYARPMRQRSSDGGRSYGGDWQGGRKSSNYGGGDGGRGGGRGGYSRGDRGDRGERGFRSDGDGAGGYRGDRGGRY